MDYSDVVNNLWKIIHRRKTWIKPWLILFFVFSNSALSATATPQHAIKELWQALSRQPNQSPDIAKLKELFHESGVVFGGRYKDSKPRLSSMQSADFIKQVNRVSETGFYECEVYREIDVYDRFATAYSVVESRTNELSVAPDFVGVNSIQLYKLDEQWKIISLYYQVEKQGLAVNLGEGSSGNCID